MAVLVRPMTTRDVAPAAAMLRRGEWGDREGFFAWAVDHPACRPFVADDDGRLVRRTNARADHVVVKIPAGGFAVVRSS